MDRPGTCIILDKKYNIANSSCHFGTYGSIWTGPSPKKYMDLRSFGPYNIFFCDGPVDILPYDPQGHVLFADYDKELNNILRLYANMSAKLVKKWFLYNFFDKKIGFVWNVYIMSTIVYFVNSK
jgi:hypothetical protein